jgi:alkyl sulfatase BDS1-like metallo-beta-lactamase superfamily hydrolase
MAIQVSGPAAWHERLSIDIVLTDTDERYRLRLANGVLTCSARPQQDEVDAELTTTRRALPALAQGSASADELASAGIQLTGDASTLRRLMAVLDPGDKDFAIVTP